MSIKTLNKQNRFNELKQLYTAYSEDKNSVNIDWQEFFNDLTPDASLFLEEFNLNNEASVNQININIAGTIILKELWI